jgi:hypothetical protein
MRLVLVNVPHPEQYVTAVVSSIKPGVSVTIREPNSVANVCYHPSETWNRLTEVYQKYAKTNGIDLYVGRRIACLLRQEGIDDIGVDHTPASTRRIILGVIFTISSWPMSTTGSSRAAAFTEKGDVRHEAAQGAPGLTRYSRRKSYTAQGIGEEVKTGLTGGDPVMSSLFRLVNLPSAGKGDSE